MYNNYSLIIPAVPQDIGVFLNNAIYFFDYLPISKIVFIGPPTIKEVLPIDERYQYLNENDIIDISALKELYAKKLNGGTELKKFGWYVQQFIKMAYSLRCNEEYYLLWDADTIPVKKISLFDEHTIPYLDYKTEFVEVYFKTLSIILPGYSKSIKGSFIAEHMLIKTAIMREMIESIETNIIIEGASFDQKIINSIDIDDLTEGGFSEFETYGTYVMHRYNSSYSLRRWFSMRYGGYFFEHNKQLPLDALSWLSNSYDAISIEKWSPLSIISSIINKKWFIRIFPASILEFLALTIRLFRKLERKISISKR